MGLDKCYADISKFPQEEQAVIRHLAEKHNALCDFQKLAFGDSPAEQVDTISAITVGRTIYAWFKRRRFGILGGIAASFLLTKTLEALGIPTDHVGPLIKSFISAVSGGSL